MDESSSPASAKTSAAPPPLHTLVEDASRWALFLDFDGTLVDLAPSPDEIEVPPELPGLLQSLLTVFNGALAIFTGRALADLDHYLGIRLPAAGQHGVQRRIDVGGPLWQTSPTVLESARASVLEMAEAWPRLLVEDKGSTLAVHYRAVPEAGDQVHASLAAIVDASEGALEIQEGKYVYELRPAGVDKGAALKAFMNTRPFSGRLPLVVGDDVTDEAAFTEAIGAGGTAVKIGGGVSLAPWRLDTPQSVREWLHDMLEVDR